MKVALIYDRVNKWGGAERVLLALHEIFPNAPLYTAVYSPEKAKWAKVFPEVIPSFLQRIPFMQDKHEFLAPLMPIAFETFNMTRWDLVISVTSEAAKGVITRPPTKHICYCLTPTRYLWSHYKTYFKGASFKGMAKPFVSYLRYWDKIAAQRPDMMMAISSAVQKRVMKYYNRDSEIIYPPVEINKFKVQNPKFKTTTQNLKAKNFYLVVSRLVPYKSVGLVVETFNELGESLVIVGTGSEESKLKSRAKINIQFVKNLTDEELASYYQKARALIFPQEEDFGITAVEAQAAGTPVIAYKAGGALEIIIATGSSQDRTGVFFKNQTKGDLINAVKRLESMSFDKEIVQANAKRFSKEIFKSKFILLMDQLISNKNI